MNEHLAPVSPFDSSLCYYWVYDSEVSVSAILSVSETIDQSSCHSHLCICQAGPFELATIILM